MKNLADMIFLTAISFALLAAPRAANAGPTDTPLPTFSDAKPALHVYTAVGVVKNNNLETVFICANLGTAPVNVGVELFDKTGAVANSIANGDGVSLDVGIGATITIATGATAVLTEDVIMTGLPNLANGSGRVVATAKTVSCTAWLIDQMHAVEDPALSALPPPVGINLPLVFVP